MTDIDIFLKHINLPQLAHEPNLSEEFFEKYIIPNHLKYDKDQNVTRYCLREFIQRQTFSEKFIEKHIQHFMPNMIYVFEYQKISLEFINKYYKNNFLACLLKNNKINLPIDFIIEKLHYHHHDGELFKLILKKYDMPKEFILEHIDYINAIIYHHYDNMDYVDYYGDIVISKHNAQLINNINSKTEIFK